MCAAPGSKTAQIIEMMHSRDGSVPSKCDVTVPGHYFHERLVSSLCLHIPHFLSTSLTFLHYEKRMVQLTI